MTTTAKIWRVHYYFELSESLVCSSQHKSSSFQQSMKVLEKKMIQSQKLQFCSSSQLAAWRRRSPARAAHCLTSCLATSSRPAAWWPASTGRKLCATPAPSQYRGQPPPRAWRQERAAATNATVESKKAAVARARANRRSRRNINFLADKTWELAREG